MKKFIKKFWLPAIGVLLITLGVVGYVFKNQLNDHFVPVVTAQVQPNDKAEDGVPKQSEPKAGSGVPVRIEIPDAHINISVINGYYDVHSQTWTLSKTNAQYAVMTPKPNTHEGNTFMYGHALSNVFGRLPAVKPGSLVYVTTDRNQRFTYAMTHSFTTDPTGSDFLNYRGKPILSLQTCSGVRYQNRTIYVFDLVGVENA